MKLYKEGQILTHEGSTSQELFILVDGVVGIFKGEVKVAEFRQKGTILGEMSVILKKPRTATIRALKDTYTIVLQADLDELMKKFPDIVKKIMINLADRLMNTTEEYWQLAVKVQIDEKLKN